MLASSGLDIRNGKVTWILFYKSTLYLPSAQYNFLFILKQTFKNSIQVLFLNKTEMYSTISSSKPLLHYLVHWYVIYYYTNSIIISQPLNIVKKFNSKILLKMISYRNPYKNNSKFNSCSIFDINSYTVKTVSF